MLRSKPEVRDVSEAETRCGWWAVQPEVLQRFASPEWVLLCFCAAGFVQGMVISGFINVSLPTLERRFHLRSVEAGLVVSMYNVGSLLLMAPVTFFGGEMHKPRIMATGVFVMGLGSFLYSLPHFIAPQYKYSQEVKDLCPYEDAKATIVDPEGSRAVRNYRFVFMVANLVHGCSTVPFYTLAIAYLDDNLSARKSSWYIGIYYTAAIIGPAVGFIMGGMLLNVYTDITVDPRSLGLTPSSSVWIGAWWIGFLITGCSAILISVPIMGFPKTLPGAAEAMAEKRLEVDLRALEAERDAVQQRLSDMPKAVFHLLRNNTFIFISLAATVETMIGSGYSNFAAKLFESQFGMTAASAALLLGMIAIPSASLGCFLGGCVVSKLDLRCANIIRMCIGVSMVTWFFFFMLLSYCPNLQYEGINVKRRLVLTPKCTSECGCPLSFNPICGRDYKMYMSPCLAGCREATQNEKAVMVYGDCDCIATEPSQSNTSEFTVAAERVRCTQECSAYLFYTMGTFLCLFSTFYISAPGISVTIRCVSARQKSFALGIQWAMIRLLGTIPAPLIFGKTVDMSCEIWSSVFDGLPNESGNCVLYDNSSLSRNMSTVLILLKTMSVVLFTCASLSYRPVDVRSPTPAPAQDLTDVGEQGTVDPANDTTGSASANREKC